MKIDRVIFEQVLEEYHTLAKAGEKLKALIAVDVIHPEEAGRYASKIAHEGRYLLERLDRIERYGVMEWMARTERAFAAVRENA